MDGAVAAPMPDEQQLEGTPAPQGPQYWADLPRDELVPHLQDKTNEYRRALELIGMTSVWRIAYSQMYGMDQRNFGRLVKEVGFGGEKGEDIVFRINDWRSYVKRRASLALGQRPAYRCLAVNDDFESLAQIESCDGALSYIANRSYSEDLERTKFELAKIGGWAWDWHRWDATGGDDVETFEGDAPIATSVKSGLPTITPKAAWEVAHDVSCTDGRHSWVIVSEYRSKWELAAEYPVSLDGVDQAIEILGLQSADTYGFGMLSGGSSGSDFMTQRQSDAIMVRHFYHARTKALPDGRYVGVAGTVVLWDVPLPTDEIPAVCFMPSRLAGTSFGYSDAWDALPIQQMLDQIISDRATNAAIFGRPNMYMDEGTTMTVDLLAKGGQLFTKKPGTEPPGVIEYPAMDAGPDTLTQELKSRMREGFGENAVTRGDKDSGVKSGTHAALYHAMAIEYASDDQQAVDANRERNGNLLLSSIKENAEHPFLIEVGGESEMPYAELFELDRFRSVKRVQVTTANPLQRTTAGRLELFNATKDIEGAYSDPSQVIEMLVSGQYKPTYQAARNIKLGVRWENQQMARGVAVPPAMAGEDWTEEIKEHLALTRIPSIRQRPEIVAIIMEHVMSHLSAAQMTNPLLAMATGTPPIQAIAAGVAPPPSPGGGGGEMKGVSKMAARQESEDVGGMGVKLPKPAQSPAAEHAAVAA
jgi:hypothetical protein